MTPKPQKRSCSAGGQVPQRIRQLSFAAAFHLLLAEYGDRLRIQQVPGYPVELPLARVGGRAGQEGLSLRQIRLLGLPEPALPERSPNPPQAGVGKEVPAELPAKSLSGEPASRGRAAGRARLISGDAPPADLAPGDVLVAPYASLYLIPFLSAAAALVLDHGGPGDHFAITAREFGLPSVCATLHATRSIPEGAWVTVDADAGLVSWE